MNTVRVNPTNAVIESITITLGLLRFRRRSRNSLIGSFASTITREPTSCIAAFFHAF